MSELATMMSSKISTPVLAALPHLLGTFKPICRRHVSAGEQLLQLLPASGSSSSTITTTSRAAFAAAASCHGRCQCLWKIRWVAALVGMPHHDCISHYHWHRKALDWL